MTFSNKKPLVSVVMNCFNSATHLREAIDSVYSQAYSNWEIIFWDNVSTDQSAEIAQSYDSRLRYFRGQETIPLGAARNEAMKQSQGEYIAFLDCDDLWFASSLEDRIKAMLQQDCVICYAGVLEINESGHTLGSSIPKPKSGNIFNELLQQFDINVPTVMIKKSCLIDSGLQFDKSVTASEEYCLFMQLAVTYSFHVLPKILAKYRIHEKSLTNHSISKWADEREYTLRLIQKNHPAIETRYPKGFKEAYARASYYRARYFLSKGKKTEAVGQLRKSIFVNYKYFLLFFLLMMPSAIWNFVHKRRTNRASFS